MIGHPRILWRCILSELLVTPLVVGGVQWLATALLGVPLRRCGDWLALLQRYNDGRGVPLGLPVLLLIGLLVWIGTTAWILRAAIDHATGAGPPPPAGSRRRRRWPKPPPPVPTRRPDPATTAASGRLPPARLTPIAALMVELYAIETTRQTHPSRADGDGDPSPLDRRWQAARAAMTDMDWQSLAAFPAVAQHIQSKD